MNKMKLLPLMLALFATYCAPEKSEPKPEYTCVAEKKVNGIDIAVQDIYWNMDVKESKYGIAGFRVAIINKSNDVAHIVWDSSSIRENNNSHPLITESQKYIDAGKSIPPTLLVPGTQFSTTICPSDRVEFIYGNWSIRVLPGSTFSIVLCFSINNTYKLGEVKITLKKNDQR